MKIEIMSIKRSFVLSLFAIAFLFVANSCNKCTIANTNEETGVIVKGAIIYPKSGYITSEVSSYHFNGTGNYANSFEVSFDGGQTRVPVNWGSYDILANPMSVNCKASILKDVTVDTINGIVRYNATATTCKSCEQKRYIENYVLVPKINSGYTVWVTPKVTVQ